MDTNPHRTKTGHPPSRNAFMVACLAALGLLVSIQYVAQLRLKAENKSLRQQLRQLESERAQTFRSSATHRALSLPAPRIPASAASVPQAKDDLPATNIITRMLGGENPPGLTPEQVESYLQQARRSAGSLLAAFRAQGDDKLLQEALEKYPTDARVNFAAAFKKDASPDERRQRLAAFKQAAPDNALPNYLAALDYFKSGQSDQAVQELSLASAKPQFRDYSAEFVQDTTEAYRTAGFSEAESKMVALSSLLLPQLPELRNLGQKLVDLAQSYRQTGDQASAQAALQMAVGLGQRLENDATAPLLTQLVGMAIEKKALADFDPASAFPGGQTIKDRLDELAKERTDIKQLTQQFDPLQPNLSAQDWISYADRTRILGEKSALQWLVAKFGKP